MSLKSILVSKCYLLWNKYRNVFDKYDKCCVCTQLRIYPVKDIRKVSQNVAESMGFLVIKEKLQTLYMDLILEKKNWF